MVTITDVDDYFADKFDKNTTLSKYLIPYLYSEDLERKRKNFFTNTVDKR